MSDGELKIACSVAENVNIAFYQNAVPFLRELTLENTIGRDLGEVVVRLSSEPPFCTPAFGGSTKSPTRPPTTFTALTSSSIRFSWPASRHPAALKSTSSPRARGTLSKFKVDVNLLPPSHWGGAVGARSSLPRSFDRPTPVSMSFCGRPPRSSPKRAATLRLTVTQRERRPDLGRFPKPFGPRSSVIPSPTFSRQRALNAKASRCAVPATFCRERSEPVSTYRCSMHLASNRRG